MYVCDSGIPSNDDVEGGVRGAVGGILLEPLQWHQLLTPKGWKRLTTEGHTFADAILTVAMAQIGQVMLVWPHQMYLTGITAGVILMVASGWFNIWSMWILVIFYMERKNAMIKEGTWWEEGGVRRTVSQLHEVVGFFWREMAANHHPVPGGTQLAGNLHCPSGGIFWQPILHSPAAFQADI